MNAPHTPAGWRQQLSPVDRRLWRGCASRRVGEPPGRQFAHQFQADLDFIAMLKGFRPSGGLMRFSEVGPWLERHQPGASRLLGRWQTRFELCELHWRGQLWVPACQFDRDSGRLRADLGRVARRLGLSPSDTPFLLWLIRPQPAHGHLSPAELLATRPDDFERAAQADWGEPWAHAA
jgi:hypothetical protein